MKARELLAACFLLFGALLLWPLLTIANHPVLIGGVPALVLYLFAVWAAMLLISMMAVMFLPRQFHILVVQNPRERDVNTVPWSFPLYLLLISRPWTCSCRSATPRRGSLRSSSARMSPGCWMPTAAS